MINMALLSFNWFECVFYTYLVEYLPTAELSIENVDSGERGEPGLAREEAGHLPGNLTKPHHPLFGYFLQYGAGVDIATFG